jgi:hypothetical protein
MREEENYYRIGEDTGAGRGRILVQREGEH